MLDTINQFFGFTKTDYADLVKKGAIILDVRSKGEFAGGHIKGSINIPVDQLQNNLSKLKDKKDDLFLIIESLLKIKVLSSFEV